MLLEAAYYLHASNEEYNYVHMEDFVCTSDETRHQEKAKRASFSPIHRPLMAHRIGCLLRAPLQCFDTVREKSPGVL